MHAPRDTPNPAGPTPPTSPAPLAKNPGGLDDYHRIADTIGGVPNLRWKDNILQTAFIAVCAVIGSLLGWLLIPGKDIETWMRIAIGLLGGLVIGTFLSGSVLMIIGWIRAGRKK